jgi:hypothetical protein
MCLVKCFILYDLTNMPPSTAHGEQANVLQTKLCASADRYIHLSQAYRQEQKFAIGTAFRNLFHSLQKLSVRAKVCALCIDKEKKIFFQKGLNRQHIHVSSVTFRCAVCPFF